MKRMMIKSPVAQEAMRKLMEQMRFAPDTGHIMLFDQRMLLMHGFSLAELRRELIERLGQDMARGILTRIGYQQGLEDYQRVHSQVGDDIEAALALGFKQRDMEGYASVTPLELRLDIEQGTLFSDSTWVNSWEAEAQLKNIGISGVPACWMSVGYASGFATALLGKPLIFREIECVAMGHTRCRTIGKPAEEWDNIEEDLRFLQVEDFVDPPIKRRVKSPPRPDTLPLTPSGPAPNELVGASSAFNSVVYLLKRVGQTDATALFLGESGVGKERFSRALHQIGKRAAGPFISVNCAAIPHELIEAELFGVEKGAFTGATASRPGRFERANGGTLFLDEIGSLPFHAQGKLLRALQEREVERVGSTEVLPVDVRVVAATNEDLRKAVAEGRFRADLFFRLNVFPIRIPPLRERREDIPLMLNVFVERFSQRFEKPIKGITRHALDALWNYDWPGNVRELENMVERAVILCDPDSALDVHHLFSGGEQVELLSLQISPQGTLETANNMAGQGVLQNPRDVFNHLLDQGLSMEQMEHYMIECALDRNKGKLAAAARDLKIGRGQMQYRVSKLPPRIVPPRARRQG